MGLAELARSRKIASTVVSSTSEIPSDIAPLFFCEQSRDLLAEIDFATHLFIITRR